jgi:RimJ/RimL family protein N-acetyltransferase
MPLASSASSVPTRPGSVPGVQPDWPITTERLVLRPFEADDFAALLAIYSDEEVSRYLYHEPRGEAETRELLARKIAATSIEQEGNWLSAAATHDGVLVVDVALHWVSEQHKTAEVGFSTDPRHQGQGYATEAARALLDWAFSRDFHRVIGRVEARNAASARVLEKLGMRCEAHLVENEWVKNEWQSELVYAILRREWR